MLHQKWTNDQSVPTSVVHYMISIQDCLSQTKELASENEQKSKVKYKSCYYRKAKKRTFRAGELVLVWTLSLISMMENEWEGPCSVFEKCDDSVHKLLEMGHC